jgi:hypothetical protein
VEWTAPSPNPPAESLIHIYKALSKSRIYIDIYIYIYAFFHGQEHVDDDD